jgi:hypothetical protein
MKSLFVAVAACAVALGVSLSPALAESTQFLAALNGGHESAAPAPVGTVYGTAGPKINWTDGCLRGGCKVPTDVPDIGGTNVVPIAASLDAVPGSPPGVVYGTPPGTSTTSCHCGVANNASFSSKGGNAG